MDMTTGYVLDWEVNTATHLRRKSLQTVHCVTVLALEIRIWMIGTHENVHQVFTYVFIYVLL